MRGALSRLWRALGALLLATLLLACPGFTPPPIFQRDGCQPTAIRCAPGSARTVQVCNALGQWRDRIDCARVTFGDAGASCQTSARGVPACLQAPPPDAGAPADASSTDGGDHE